MKVRLALALALASISSNALAKSNEFVQIERQAHRGDREAQFKLGMTYQLGGDDVKAEESKAMLWLSRSAEQGYNPAIAAYGLALYKAGQRSQSMYWIKVAATNGDARSQYLLGVEYWTGDVVKKDDQAALYFLKKAGDQGLKPAQDSYNDIYSQLNPPKNDPLVDEATPTPPSGKYYVQLGAFSILSNATSYWNRISDQVDFMDKDPSIEDSKLHILRVYGYTASQANNVCKQVKTYGENCLVRHQ